MPPDDDAPLAARIAAALPAARWFAGKGATVERVTLHDRLRPPEAAGLSLVLADVRIAGRPEPDRYCLATDEAGDDTAGTPACAGWLVGMMLAGASLPGRCGRCVGHRVDGRDAARPASAPTSVVPVGGDASNSSFVVRFPNAGFVVKLFRRCRDGIQPEVEVGEFLATAAAWDGSPRLLGWLEYAAPHAPPLTLATVHDLAPDCTTAWDRLVAMLVSGGASAAESRDVQTIVAAIGTATGRMHRALGSRPDVPAFSAEPPTAAGREAAADRMTAHAAGVFTLVESRLAQLAQPIAGRLRRLLAARDGLLDRFRGFRSLAMGVPNIRVHGDYHLGQVLVGARDDRVLVIDFEGEPGRTLDERRAKACAAKDVAGMCRSFDYLVRHVAAATRREYSSTDSRLLESIFLDAYRAASSGGPWWPAEPAEAHALLDIHRLDKAVYELAYEIENRPDWIAVPLAALEEMAAMPAPSRA